MSFKQEITELVNQSEIKGAFFYSPDEITNYRCIASSDKDFTENNDYILYQLKPLVRLLARRRDIISKELLEEMFIESSLCMILEWNDHSRKVFIFDSESDISLLLKEKHEEVKKLFQKYFYEWRNK
tara:strand:- start:50756 stop:51136 length:381 start_codon:yes stop_codon:yes gene_type:complete